MRGRDVDPSTEPGQARDEAPRAPDRKDPPRQRGNQSQSPGNSPQRPPQDTRRKRSNEQRYTGWGDGIERVYCARAEQFLPQAFPVSSHAGAATIRATIVARRSGGLLLCNFSHHGPHVWPDGELVGDGPAMPAAASETP